MAHTVGGGGTCGDVVWSLGVVWCSVALHIVLLCRVVCVVIVLQSALVSSSVA